MKNRDFRISDLSRKSMTYFNPVFETDEDIQKFYRQAQDVAFSYNKSHTEKITASKVNVSAVLHLVYQTVISAYLRNTETNPFSRISVLAEKNQDCANVLEYYNTSFPTYIEEDKNSKDTEEKVRAFFVHQVFQANPALLKAMKEMLDQENMNFPKGVKALNTMLGSYLQGSSITDSNEEDLFAFLTHPARLYPDSLTDQIAYIIKHWDALLGDKLKTVLLRSLDFINEEEKDHGVGNPGDIPVVSYSGESEYESFTEDRNWMPNVVMVAKNALVWLDQLSKKYQRDIHTLDQVPQEELEELKDRGFTALWLIGLWERSFASKKIKNLCGNPDAESSAYSLKGYDISSRMGGWNALNNLKERCSALGIRLASDMVPNHTGIDSDWMYNHSDYFIQQDYPPFPSYTFNGPDLSTNPDVEIKIEDHYFNQTDAAVAFRKVDKRSGKTTYIFHGNDGTTMPWNDTAQLDFLNPQTREAVIQQILSVARSFPIIRFDAAMTLAKRHIQRLWYPKPGNGGDIAGRSSYGMSDEEFNRRIPNEFWREVVDRIQTELPDTLLLAEAFWMMESYFVRTLGMHRVYNSAFMHMTKNQDNEKYRDSIKATLAFDPEILKRYVNFMSNPDEETAIAQFGDGDKYFGVCTLLATMPGLPMFGHGQIEGFREKYGMEYQRSYWDEKPNEGLMAEHRRRIFPLLKKRRLFSGCQNFNLFDVNNNGTVQQDVYAYTNGNDSQMTLVLYNNSYEHKEGVIYTSAPKLNKTNRQLETVSLAQALRLTMSPRRFIVYKNFNDGLTYIAPSMKIYDEGYFVSLNGYETRVLTDIHEIEDIDGIYASLCEFLNGRGVEDLETEKRLLYLKPFFDIAQNLKNPKFLKDIKNLITGKSSATARRDVLQALATYYTYVEEIPGLFPKIGLKFHNVKPAVIVNNIAKLEDVCKIKIFKDGNTIILDDAVLAVISALIAVPFVEDSDSLEDVEFIFKSLMLHRLFECDPNKINMGEILVCFNANDVKTLLDNQAFLNLIGCNEYQGIRWYRGESFDECMYITLLSKALFTPDVKKIDQKQIEKELNYWLQKSEHAGYKVDLLK